jgi:hypothetical protein
MHGPLYCQAIARQKLAFIYCNVIARNVAISLPVVGVLAKRHQQQNISR